MVSAAENHAHMHDFTPCVCFSAGSIVHFTAVRARSKRRGSLKINTATYVHMNDDTDRQ